MKGLWGIIPPQRETCVFKPCQKPKDGAALRILGNSFHSYGDTTEKTLTTIPLASGGSTILSRALPDDLRECFLI